MRGNIFLVATFFFFLVLNAQNWRFVKDIGFMGEYRNQKLIAIDNKGFVGLLSKSDSIAVTPECIVSSGNNLVHLLKCDSLGNCSLLVKSLPQFYYDFDLGPNEEIKTIGFDSVFTFDATGKKIKSLAIKGSLSYGRKVKYDNLSNYYLVASILDTLEYAGYRFINNSGAYVQHIFKFNENDSLLWSKKFDIKMSYPGFEIAVDKSNNLLYRVFPTDSLILNGSLLSVSNRFVNTTLFKLNPSGDLLWFKIMESAFPQGGFIRTDDKENIYVSGRFCDTLKIGNSFVAEKRDQGHFCGDVYVAKLNSNGAAEWIAGIGSNHREDNVYGFDVSGDGISYLQTDWQYDAMYVNNDSIVNPWYQNHKALMIRLDANGNLTWFDMPVNDFLVPSAVAVDDLENAYFTGMWNSWFVLGNQTFNISCGSSNHFYLAGLRGKSLVTNVSSENQSKSIQVYPVPSDGEVKIKSTEITSLKVFDLYGQLVLEVRNSGRASETTLDLSHLAKGVYFINLNKDKGETVTRKLVIQ